MLKTSTIAACIVALTGGATMAQTGAYDPTLSGPGAAPGGASGAAPVTSIGTPAAIGQHTAEYGTQSTSVLSQTVKNESAAGMGSSVYTPRAQAVYGTMPQDPNRVAPGQLADRYGYYGAQEPTAYRYEAQAPGSVVPLDSHNPRAVAITDEYGYQYNSEGQRIGKARGR